MSAPRPFLRRAWRRAAFILLFLATSSFALHAAEEAPAAAGAPAAGATGETVDDAICRLIETSAAKEGLPTAFLTRLIWRESSFRSHVVSHAGAQGIAQFMPGTAKERGLEDPFDPQAAIPASAALLKDLLSRFGNLGLAAAAYNAGPGRVSTFLSGGGLPLETRDYVRIITGRGVQDWAADRAAASRSPDQAAIRLQADQTAEGQPADGASETRTGAHLFPAEPCLKTVASLRQGMPAPAAGPNTLFAPWGVQISGNFSKDIALASFRRAAARYQPVFGELTPVIIATRMAGRGRRVFYRVRLPAQTRAEASALCNRLRKAGGPCIVLPN